MIIFRIVSQHSREVYMPRNNIVEENVLKLLASQFLSMIKISNRDVVNIDAPIIDVPCGPENLEDCHRIKGDRTIVKFSCRRKSSVVLRENKKLKNIDGSKFDFNAGVKLYINESLCPYYRGLWGKYKKLLLNKVIFSFYTINGILHIKKSE